MNWLVRDARKGRGSPHFTAFTVLLCILTNIETEGAASQLASQPLPTDRDEMAVSTTPDTALTPSALANKGRRNTALPCAPAACHRILPRP